MSIKINFINANGAGFGEELDIRNDVTIAGFFSATFPGQNPRDFTVRINSAPVTAQQVLRHGDNVSIIRIGAAAAPTPSNVGVYVPPSNNITVRFIDNGACGFADNVSVPAGTLLADFLGGRNVDTDAVVIRVNGDIAVRDYVLRVNDAVVVAPKRIEGAATIRVSLVCNDGTGFADYVDISEGSTLRDLVAAKTNLGDPKNYVISLNGSGAPLSNQVLRNGDRISITPNKIQGA
jgi:sulfur carrier protein ThiS